MKNEEPPLIEPPAEPEAATAKLLPLDASKSVIVGGVIAANRPQDYRNRRRSVILSRCLVKARRPPESARRSVHGADYITMHPRRW